MTVPSQATPDTARSSTPRLAVCTAVFVGAADVKRAELGLGWLSADAGVDVLDSIVVEWAPGAPAPCSRAVRNLPRLAALTDAAWDEHLRRLTKAAPTVADRLRRGAIAMISLVGIQHDALVCDQLRAAGAQVTVEHLSEEKWRRSCRDE